MNEQRHSEDKERFLKKIVLNNLSLTISEVLNKIISALFLFYVARTLGSTDIGKYFTAIAFISFFAFLPGFGLSSIITRQVSRDYSKATEYVGNAMALRFFLFLVYIALIVITVNLFNYDRDTTLLIYIFGMSILFEIWHDVFLSIMNAYEKMRILALLSVIFNLVRIGSGVAVLLLSGRLILFGLTLLFTSFIKFVGISYTASVKLKLVKIKFIIDTKFWKWFMKEGMPLMLSGLLFTLFLQVDVIMISKFRSATEVGWYGVARGFLDMAGFIPTIILQVLFPSMSRFGESSKDELNLIFNNLFRYLLTTGILASFILFIFAKRLTLLCYGGEYIKSAITLKILSISLFIGFLSFLMHTILVSVNRQSIATVIWAIVVPFNIITNLVLIPKYGYIGASITRLASEILVFSISYFYIQKLVFKFRPNFNHLKPILIAIICSLLIQLGQGLNLFLLISSFILIYVVISFWSKVFTKREVVAIATILLGKIKG